MPNLSFIGDPLLHTPEAARILKISPVTLERWRGLGAGPKFCRLGRAIRYRLSDLHSWVDANRVAMS